MAQNNQWKRQYKLSERVPDVPAFEDLIISTDGKGLVHIEHGSAVVDISNGSAFVYHRITAKPSTALDTLLSEANEPVDENVPDSAFIRVGPIQVNTINPIMKNLDLDDSETAMLLLVPQDLANIDGKGPGTWTDSMQRICDINGYPGVNGIAFWNHHLSEDSYETLCCYNIQQDASYARSYKGQVTTGLFMATEEIIMDHLYPRRDELAERGAPFLKEIFSGEAEHKVWAANENPDHPANAKSINFPSCASGWEEKNGSKQSAIVVALAFNHN